MLLTQRFEYDVYGDIKDDIVVENNVFNKGTKGTAANTFNVQCSLVY